jgi:hypothetical protein
MNLLELNARLGVKLNQSYDTLYELEYMEYSFLLNIINNDIEEENKKVMELNKINEESGNLGPVSVNLPSHLKIK